MRGRGNTRTNREVWTSLRRSGFQKSGPRLCTAWNLWPPGFPLAFKKLSNFLARGLAILSGRRTCASSTVLLIHSGFSVHLKVTYLPIYLPTDRPTELTNLPICLPAYLFTYLPYRIPHVCDTIYMAYIYPI